MNRVMLAGVGAGGAFCATFALLHFAHGSDSGAELARFGRAYAVVQANYVDAPQDERRGSALLERPMPRVGHRPCSLFTSGCGHPSRAHEGSRRRVAPERRR